MSELGWVQLTMPMPAASACSASKPSAIWPDAATAVPPCPEVPVAAGAVTVVSVLTADTVTGCGADPPGVAETGLSVAEPVPVNPAVAAAVAARRDGRAIIAMCAAPLFGAGGGQDLVTDVTAAICGAGSAAACGLRGSVRHATAYTTASTSSTAPKSPNRRITRLRPNPAGYPRPACGPGVPGARGGARGASAVPPAARARPAGAGRHAIPASRPSRAPHPSRRSRPSQVPRHRRAAGPRRRSPADATPSPTERRPADPSATSADA